MEFSFQNPALTVALAVAAGMVAHVVARHLKVPSIVLLLLTGALLGPELAGVVRPETLGRALLDLVGMAVAVILFEGGLSLSIHRLRGEVRTLRRLITIGALVTAVGTALAARLLLDWPWELAIPFGALLVVTGPTVVQPVLRRVPVRQNLTTILEGEAVFIDGMGAILAVVALEFVLTTGAAEAAVDLLSFPGRLAVGIALGVAGGLLVGVLLRSEELVPEGLENVLVLAFVLALFQVSEAVMHETGIMAAAVAGLMVGNMETRVDEALKEFKEQLTVFLLALLFVLLAATVQLGDVVGLGWAGVGTVVVIMLVRPLSVAISTMGGELELRERAFLAWLAPRGVVAAAVAALFAQRFAREGIPGGEEFQALVFLVIAVTVVVQGGLAGPVASYLGVRRERRSGYVIVGANPIGRTLAHALEQAAQDVVLVDSSEEECAQAAREDLRVVHGSATEEGTLIEAGLPERQGLVTVTPSPSLNVRVVKLVRTRFGMEWTAVCLSRVYGGLEAAQVHEAGAGILFGRPVDVEFWSHEFRTGSIDVSRWRFLEEGEEGSRGPGGEVWRERPDIDLLPLLLFRNERAEPVTDRLEFRPGDEVYFAWSYAAGAGAGRWLSDLGWKPVSELSSGGSPAVGL